MGTAIQPLGLDSVLTIAFIDHGRGGVFVTWVCATPGAYSQAIDELRSSPHCEIIARGPSTVIREEK